MNDFNNEELVAIWPAKSRDANIVWQVSDVCNYKCSYCNPGNWGAKHRNLDTKKYLKSLSSLINQFKDQGYESFKFFFSGGEPSLWPPLLDVLELIHSSVDRPLVAINTNLSQDLKWWEKNQHFFQDIVASFHIEYTNQNRYMENAKFLQYVIPYFCCRVLLHDERFGEVVDFVDKLKVSLENYAIEYAPLFEALTPHSDMHIYKEEWKNKYISEHSFERQQKVPIKRENIAWSEGFLEHYKSGATRGLNSTRVINSNRNHFKGWTCWVNDSVFINPRGDIRLASCNVGPTIGNISDDKIILPTRPVICSENICGCGTDISISKVHPDHLSKFSSRKSND